jgi:hypothetical protein
MRIVTLLALALGAAGGYVATRRLVEGESPPAGLPGAIRQPLHRTQERVRGARDGVVELLAEAARGRSEAEQELTEDYLRRTGRWNGPSRA